MPRSGLGRNQAPRRAAGASERAWDFLIHDDTTAHRISTGRGPVIALGALLVAAALIRVYGLGAQLWLDEISALHSIRRPLLAIVSEWPGAASHILYEVMAHVSRAMLGETPVAIRLPAAVFGVASVWAFYVLARAMAGEAALFLAALFAGSYHLVFFSQNARGYTLLIFLYLVATWLLLRMLEGDTSVRTGAWYAVAVALTAYAQPLGAFVLLGHASVVGLAALTRFRSETRVVPIGTFLRWAMAGGVGIALLYLPFLASMLAFARMNRASAGEGPRLGIALVVEIIEGLGAALGGPVGLIVVAVVGGVGLLALIRRAGTGVALLLVPLIVQAVILVALGVGIHPRYFAIALPAVYVIGGYGVFVFVAAGSGVLARWTPRRGMVRVAALVIIVVASLFPLRRYFRYPKQDFLGAAAGVADWASPTDARVGVRFVGHVLADYYGLPFTTVDSLPQLRALEDLRDRVWVVTTLERLLAVEDSALVDRLHRVYRHVEEFPGTVGGGTMHVYVRER